MLPNKMYLKNILQKLNVLIFVFSLVVGEVAGQTDISWSKTDMQRLATSSSQNNMTSMPELPGIGCTLSGPSAVYAGYTYNYTIICDGITPYWYVDCGTLVSVSADVLTVKWNPVGCTTGSIRGYDANNNLVSTKTVTISVAALSGGTVSNTNQTINYNTTPVQLNASMATGGSCTSYAYQWQQSADNISFFDIEGGSGQNFQPGTLTVTSYYRRKVTCGSSVAYSNVATVSVAPPLYGGYVTNPNQAIAVNTTPGMINATAATGGNCSGSYSYQWWQQTATSPQTDIPGATGQNYQPGTLSTSTFFGRKVICNGEVAYTETNASVTVIYPLNGGCITSGNQVVAHGSLPVPITGSAATEGNCNGNYTYQWQSSTDNEFFSDIEGATSQDLSFSSTLAQTTYFQRKACCGQEIQFAGSVQVAMVDPYYSVAKSGTFTKNNCAAGGVGSSVTYTVPAGTYTSVLSQVDADAQAQNDVNTNGQAYANSNGYCTWYNVQISGTFTKNNCTTGGSGSQVTYTVAAGTYSSTISQADADSKAQNDVNTNGQNFANVNGYCAYFSVQKSGTFTRNNCATGGVGSVVTYTVSAGAYSSLISQADADAQAQNDVIANGQNYANSNGYCTWYSTAKSGTFTKNNCTAGGVGSQVTYTVAAGAYSSTISQADADGKAESDVNANGQNYANTNGYCTYYNIQTSGTFTKNNCAAGGTGSQVTYIVPAGTYSSTISQSDANAKAQNDVNANGQNYANNNGYCTWYSAAKSGNFTRNNCPSGYVGSSVTYTVSAGAYSSTISQTDADAKAQNDVNTNGQNYANTNGTCTSTCNTTTCSGAGKKCINGVCQTGVKVYTSSVELRDGSYRCTYHYEWSDGSWSQDYMETRPVGYPCPGF